MTSTMTSTMTSAMTSTAINSLRRFIFPRRDTEATINARRRANFRAESRANPSTEARPTHSRDLWDVPRVPRSAVRMAERILEDVTLTIDRL